MNVPVVHAIKRSRHSAGQREIVCRCGFVATGAERRVRADFDAHMKIGMLRQRVPALLRATMSKFSTLARRVGRREPALDLRIRG